MATKGTQTATALYEVRHALLSLIGSIAVANLAAEAAIGLITDLIDAGRGSISFDDLVELRKVTERVLRMEQGPHMENIVRHAHELRRKVRDCQRIMGEES